MKIYDYYENNSLSSMVFLIIAIICFSALVFQIVQGVKMIKKGSLGIEALLLSLSIAITLVLTVFVSYQTYSLMKFDWVCKNQKYETITGVLDVLNVEQNDYRDTEQYDIAFSVDDILFDKTNSFSKEQKNRLVANESKNITIHYGYIGKDIVIYQIVGYD